MGTFQHSLLVLSADASRSEEVDALVDTGATFTWLPRDTLEGLGIAPAFRQEFETIEGRVIERDIAVVGVQLDGQTLPTLAVLGDPGTQAVIGAYTLEGFRLAADPVNRRLVHVRGLLMGSRVVSVARGAAPSIIPLLGEAIHRSHTDQSVCATLAGGGYE